MNFPNVSFRFKIFIIIFIAILAPTILVSISIYKKSEKAITDQISRAIINSTDLVINNIDSSLYIINETSNTLLTDEKLSLMANLKDEYFVENKIRRYSELRDLLSSFSNRMKNALMLKGIDSYYLYISEQDAIISSKTTYYENINEQEIDSLKGLNDRSYIESWFVTIPLEYSMLGLNQSRLMGERLVTYNKVLNDDEGKLAGILAVNVDESLINDTFSKVLSGTAGEVAVIDMTGGVISYSDKSLVGKQTERYNEINRKISGYNKKSGAFFQRWDRENDFVIYSISNFTGWRYIVLIPATQVLGKVMEIQDFVLLVISIAVLFVFGITSLLSYIFYKPLEKLVCAMQKIENRNLDVRINDKRQDEYQKVYSGFNNMVTELKYLIKDLTNEKVLKREADIKLLQAQINPHFLYNTLESIHSIAKIKKVDEISSMVAALSKFFRISLSGGKDMVPLKDAIELVINYLTIQNIRFNGKIRYRVSVPEEMKGIVVPKLILQPIVENSIYHGIEKKRGEGEVIISGFLENEWLFLVVEDNGIGICESDLAEVKRSLQDINFLDSKNFALKNLNQQIKLNYGSDYGIDIHSIPGEGTCVLIKLPLSGKRGAV